MAPSSALASAPASDRTPPRTQAARNASGLGRAAATVPGVRKMPAPMTEETTSIVASNRPSSGRRRSRGWRSGVIGRGRGRDDATRDTDTPSDLLMTTSGPRAAGHSGHEFAAESRPLLFTGLAHPRRSSAGREPCREGARWAAGIPAERITNEGFEAGGPARRDGDVVVREENA